MAWDTDAEVENDLRSDGNHNAEEMLAEPNGLDGWAYISTLEVVDE